MQSHRPFAKRRSNRILESRFPAPVARKAVRALVADFEKLARLVSGQRDAVRPVDVCFELPRYEVR